MNRSPEGEPPPPHEELSLRQDLPRGRQRLPYHNHMDSVDYYLAKTTSFVVIFAGALQAASALSYLSASNTNQFLIHGSVAIIDLSVYIYASRAVLKHIKEEKTSID